MPIDDAQTQVARATPWALHSFGYVAGLPAPEKINKGSLVFETRRRIVGISLATEPMGSPGAVIVSPVGNQRVIVSVVADAPMVSRRHIVVGVDVDIDGLQGGSISLNTREEAAPDRSHSIILGDPSKFTYSREERLAVRSAIWKIEDQYLSGELSRVTIPGFQTELLLESQNVRRIDATAAYEEISQQLTGAAREESWGYLWNVKGDPTPADGSAMMSSRHMTVEMSEHIHATAETILRACGVKPLRNGFETGVEVLDSVAFSLVLIRGGGSVELATREVMRTVGRYGRKFDMSELGPGSARRPSGAKRQSRR